MNEASVDDELVVCDFGDEEMEQPVLRKHAISKVEDTPNSKMLDPMIFALSDTTFNESFLIGAN